MLEEKFAFIVQKAKKSGIEFEVIFLNGEPGPTIVDYANNNDLI